MRKFFKAKLQRTRFGDLLFLCPTGPGQTSAPGRASLWFKSKINQDRVSENSCSESTVIACNPCSAGRAARIAKANVARIAKANATIAATESSERGRYDCGRYRHRSHNYRPYCNEGRGKHLAKAAIRTALRLGPRRCNRHE